KAIAEPGAGFTIHFHSAAEDAVDVSVFILAIVLVHHLFVDFSVAVVVLLIAQLSCAGMCLRVKVVAVPGQRCVALGRSAILSRSIGGITRAVAVVVLIDVV